MLSISLLQRVSLLSNASNRSLRVGVSLAYSFDKDCMLWSMLRNAVC